MKKGIYFLLLIVYLLDSNAQAQSRSQVKADKYFSQYSYALAVQQYQHVRVKNIEIYRKMAQCQVQLENYAMADSMWRQVCGFSDATAQDFLSYSMVLKINGNIEKSDQCLKKANALKPNDERIKNFISSNDEVKKLAKDNGRYVLSHLNMNTADQDFGPIWMDSSLVFSSTRDGVFPVKSRWNGNGKPFLDLYVGKLNKQDQVTEIRQFAKVTKTSFHDGPIFINRKGDHGVFTRNNGNKKKKDSLGVLELFEISKENGKWGNPIPLAYNNENYSCGHGTLTPDGKVMYFVSDMPGGLGGTDIYRIKKKSDGSWSKPENVGPAINTEGNELFPYFHESGLLIFASNGHAGLGGLDLFIAKADGDKVRKIMNAGSPLNSSYDDFSLSLNPNGDIGYFASNRKGGKGSDDIYKVSILTPWEFTKEVNILVKSSEGKLLSDAIVFVKDDNGNVLKQLKTDAEGKVNVDCTDWGVVRLECQYPGFEEITEIKSLQDVTNGDWVELLAVKIPSFNIVGTVVELQSGNGIDKVKVTLENTQSHSKNLLYSDGKGQFKLDLEKGYHIGDQITINLTCSKNGYLPFEEKMVVKLDKEGEININAIMDLRLEKMEVGKDLGKMLAVKPIYFDLGKSDIRPDAAAELDKIVAYMNENPTIEIELGSHTDCRGSKASNEKLSTARAKSSAEYVKARISNPKRIYGKGFGESKLVNDCKCEGKVTSSCSEEEHQANRRTEFKIVKI